MTFRSTTSVLWVVATLVSASMWGLPSSARAQSAGAEAHNAGTAGGEWRYWGGDAASSRYSPADQVTAENVADLEVAWRWYGANYGPEPGNVYRATPLKVGDRLYTVAGHRRTVVALDAGTGETLWMWRMRENPRWAASTRQDYGKGVAYEFHDYKKLGIDEKTLRGWVKQVGWEVLLNRRGMMWRKVPDEVKAAIDEASAIRLMLETPSIIKRPVLDTGKSLHVGFSDETYREIFG